MVSTTGKTKKTGNRKSAKKNVEIPKIQVSEAALKLGVTEEFILASVQAFYPNGTDEITLDEFEAITTALQEQLENVEQDNGEQQSTEDLTAQQQPIEEQPAEEQTVEQATTEEQTALAQSEPNELAASQPDELVEQQQQINSGVSNALRFLNDYSLALEKISSALAYIAAKKAVTNFVEIHSAVFQNDLEDYLDQFATEVSNVANNINQSDANDFLSQKGVVPKRKRTMEEIVNSYSGLF